MYNPFFFWEITYVIVDVSCWIYDNINNSLRVIILIYS